MGQKSGKNNNKSPNNINKENFIINDINKKDNLIFNDIDNLIFNNEEKENNLKQKEKVNNEGDIVIGIDFGSSGIGFAYGFFGNENGQITSGYFKGQSNNNKVSTELILDDDLKLLAFGDNCISYLSSHTKNIHHFKNIKMNLYKKIYQIKANNTDKRVNIQYIIKLILQEIKKKAIEQIENSKPDLNQNNIHWVITVPAIWDNKSKQIMIDAASEAGLIRDDDDPSNFFALEPEAASIYYHISPDSYNNINNFEEPFIVCDFGAGTVDIVTQKKEKTKDGIKFKELYKPIGGDNGCNKINEWFMDEFIKELFGEECFNNTKKTTCLNNYNDWIELEDNIEEFKQKFVNSDQLNSPFKIDLEIFSDYYKDKNIGLTDLINKFNKKHIDCKLNIDRSWKILFPYKIMEELMLRLFYSISKYIIKIVEYLKSNYLYIKYIILTGGGSLNPNLKKMIQENECLKNITCVQSRYPKLAISHGAVLYAFDHNIISPRKAKYTFGIKSRKKWNEKKHKYGGNKIFEDDEYLCENCFSKFITKNEDIRPDQIISKDYIMSFSKVTVELYKTEENNVKFCDEKDKNGKNRVEKFGEFIIDVGNNFDTSKRNAIVKMKMGGTFISAWATYCATGENAKIKCLYE